MRTIILGLGYLGLLAAQPNHLTAGEQRDGFVLLFDGRSTTGWREITGEPFPTVSWRIDDGSLQPVPGLPGFQDIRTETEYTDFELRFEWRIAKAGNSGVKYRLDKVDRWTARDGKRHALTLLSVAAPGTPETPDDDDPGPLAA